MWAAILCLLDIVLEHTILQSCILHFKYNINYSVPHVMSNSPQTFVLAAIVAMVLM